ncbi:hypothetical protein [Methylosinus sp. LW4]|uniref:hypothetical protein n=1 Tax=Methylosinus sp. LW4 TaxID=136993 RepID=UPI0012F94429|nr:hypothetical protein [Methylosinus sp. LW4]
MFDKEKKDDSASVTKAVREELDRENKYFDFAKKQIEDDRKFYNHLYKYASLFITLMVAIVSYSQFSSISQMRSDIKSSVESARTDMKISFDTARNEMKGSVELALTEVRSEIKQRLNKEFESEKIAALIYNTVKERTEKELSSIIIEETRAQVTAAIKLEDDNVKNLIEERTNKLIDDIQPIIKDEIFKRADETVKAATNEITTKIDDINQITKLSNKVLLARADDRDAFNYLVNIAEGRVQEASNRELQKIADANAMMVVSQTEGGLHLTRTFKEKQTPESIKKFMNSDLTWDREAAIDNYPQDDKTIVPDLVRISLNDPSINVAYKATSKINALTGNSFHFWRTEEISDWWGKNKETYEAKIPKTP